MPTSGDLTRSINSLVPTTGIGAGTVAGAVISTGLHFSVALVVIIRHIIMMMNLDEFRLPATRARRELPLTIRLNLGLLGWG